MGPFPTFRLALAARILWERLLRRESQTVTTQKVLFVRDLIYDRLGMDKYVKNPQLLQRLGIKLTVTNKHQTLVRESTFVPYGC